MTAPPIETKQCEGCPRLFERQPRDYPKRWAARRFCSPECANSTSRRYDRQHPPTVTVTEQRDVAMTRDSSVWQRWAVCKPGSGIDPELFQPVGTSGPALQQTAHAKAVCGSCPVEFECRDWALARGIEYGVLGGLDENERRTIRRQRATA